MNLPANFPLKKVMITVVSVVIVIALIITGVTVAVNGKAALSDEINSREVYLSGIDQSYYYEGYTTFKAEDLSKE